MSTPELDLDLLESVAKAADDLMPYRRGVGGWHWSGNTQSPGNVYLAAWVSGAGRCSLMSFSRWGMQGAQPMFLGRDYMMHPVGDFVQFEVGRQSIIGTKRADGSVYRQDIRGIAHPIAEHIVTFDPETVLALIARIRELEAQR